MAEEAHAHGEEDEAQRSQRNVEDVLEGLEVLLDFEEFYEAD